MPALQHAIPLRQKSPCHCEMVEWQPVPSRVRRIQRARKLLKASLWTPLTWTLDRLGIGLHSVQILCIDRSADRGKGRVLLLISTEIGGDIFPVQGLRARQRLLPPWSPLDPDARADARRELFEEATPEPPALDRFHLAERYREGVWQGRYTGQFECSVYVVDCTLDEFPLYRETGEGIPCWARIEDAVAWLKNPVLTPILRGEPVRFGGSSALMGPPGVIGPGAGRS